MFLCFFIKLSRRGICFCFLILMSQFLPSAFVAWSWLVCGVWLGTASLGTDMVAHNSLTLDVTQIAETRCQPGK